MQTSTCNSTSKTPKNTRVKRGFSAGGALGDTGVDPNAAPVSNLAMYARASDITNGTGSTAPPGQAIQSAAVQAPSQIQAPATPAAVQPSPVAPAASAMAPKPFMSADGKNLGTSLSAAAFKPASPDVYQAAQRNPPIQPLAKAYANGGRIKGPGTGTSDTIPAKVVQTNEPLAVSNGERIVSVAQDKLLTQMAKQAGHKSLDAMLEAGTGKPVGPTLKYLDQPGSKLKQSAKGPVKHADLGGLVGGFKRAVGLAPKQTMREKIAEEDAKRAPAAPKPQPATPAAPTPPAGVQGGLDGSGGTSLDKRMAAAGAANGAKIVRAAAGGKSPEDDKERATLLSQIPTGGNGSGPTPQPDPTQSASGSELGRNVTNAISALAPLSGGTALVNGASRLGSALGTSAAVGKVASGVSQAMPYVVPAISAGALGVASSTPSQQPTQDGSTIKAAAQESAKPEFQPSKSVYGDARPATAPEAPGAAPRLNNEDGVNVGHGVTRFNAPGKSPLFTNMTDAAGMASNQAMQSRGAITPQNMAAADALDGRYQREAQNTNQRAANAAQMATETAAAQRSTDAGLVLADKVGRRMDGERATQNAEATLSQISASPLQRAAAMKQLDAVNTSGLQDRANEGASIREAARDTTTRRAQDIGDKHFNDQNSIARSKLALDQSAEGRAAKSFEQQQATLSRLAALQAAAGKAKPGPERDAIMAEILAMNNKEPANHFDSHSTQNIKNADGSTTQGHVYSIDKRTGAIQMAPVPGAGSAATPKAEYDQLPKGATYTGTDGKQYKKG